MNEQLESAIQGLQDAKEIIEDVSHSCSRDDYRCLQSAQSFVDDVIVMLKEQEPVKPYIDFDGHDVWRCGNCGATIFHLDHTQSDEDAQNYAKFCRQCGRKVKWDAHN